MSVFNYIDLGKTWQKLQIFLKNLEPLPRFSSFLMITSVSVVLDHFLEAVLLQY